MLSLNRYDETYQYICIIIHSIIKYLISTNKIKSSKVSRFFYDNDENFIKSWKRTEEKGFLRYTLNNIILSTAVMGIMSIFFLLNKRSMFGYEQSQTLRAVLLTGVIFGLIVSPIEWMRNEFRDRRLKEKGMMESNKINIDNKENNLENSEKRNNP